MSDVKYETMEGNDMLKKFIKEVKEYRVANTDVSDNRGNDSEETNGYIDNLQKHPEKQLYLIDEHHWSGKSDENCPFLPTLEWHDLEHSPFNHIPSPSEGSVAGFAYADGHDSTARKWVVAFDSLNRKVYGEAGPIGDVDWNVVKVKLSQSLPSKWFQYVDPILGGTVDAGFGYGENTVYTIFRT